MNAVADITSEQASASDSIRALGPDVQCHELSPGRPPLFIEPKGDALRDQVRFRAWVESVRPVLDVLIVNHGGIVLRGFPIARTEDFSHFISLFPSFDSGYAGGRAPRKAISGKVMEATRLASSVRLALHSEMAYMRDYPKRIAFFSHQTAPVGGETLIGDVRNLVDTMPPAILAKIRRLGTRMARNFGPRSNDLEGSYGHMDQRGWNQSFFTEDPSQVEAICAERGLVPVWNEDGSLVVFNELEPFVVHPETGKEIYRSVLHLKPQVENAELDAEIRKKQKHPTGATLGNGERLTPEEMVEMEEVIEGVTYSWPWQDGDVMVLDNLQVWHGRNPYEGPRDVQVALLG